jgi:uncharacterized protein YqgC (DUF456 family)
MGLLAGTIIFPPLGGLMGLFVGVLVVELFYKKDAYKSFKAASFGALGVFGGMLINSLLALIFFILFLIFVF